MTKSIWTGTAVGLALCIAVLPACSKGENSSNQPASNAAAPEDAQLQWNSTLEKQLRDAIAGAPANGLKPDLFLKGDGQDAAALTEAALKYAEALAHGYVDPKKVSEVYTIPRPSADVRQGFMDAAQKGDLASWFNSLVPQTDEYKALSQAHLKYVDLASKTNFQPVPEGKPINPGGRDSRVPAVAAALQAMGYAAPSAQGQQTASARSPARYSPQLVAAVKQLQADYGLRVDGIIGGNTLAAMNVGPAGLARACAIAMERLRWLQRDPPQTQIDVNSAAAYLDYWRDGQHIDRREVVAGEPDKQTPQIQAPIVNLVAYPKWRVPDSIATDELSKKSQGWLRENNFAMENGKFVQESGPKNSLGIVKLDMDDPQAIYLHDTPAKALFGVPDRHRSHGCVRVRDAVAFANAIAAEEGVGDKFQQAMSGQQEKWVKLSRPIPVRIFYHTAFWDGSRVQFRPDVYGWDNAIAAALGLIKGVSWLPVPHSGDVGP